MDETRTIKIEWDRSRERFLVLFVSLNSRLFQTNFDTQYLLLLLCNQTVTPFDFFSFQKQPEKMGRFYGRVSVSLALSGCYDSEDDEKDEALVQGNGPTMLENVQVFDTKLMIMEQRKEASSEHRFFFFFFFFIITRTSEPGLLSVKCK
jgi:hypothetical protein